MGQPIPGYDRPGGGMKLFPAPTEHHQPVSAPGHRPAETGTPGPTINRSGTQNDQWQTTVYDYAPGVCQEGQLATQLRTIIA